MSAGSAVAPGSSQMTTIATSTTNGKTMRSRRRWCTLTAYGVAAPEPSPASRHAACSRPALTTRPWPSMAVGGSEYLHREDHGSRELDHVQVLRAQQRALAIAAEQLPALGEARSQQRLRSRVGRPVEGALEVPTLRLGQRRRCVPRPIVDACRSLGPTDAARANRRRPRCRSIGRPQCPASDARASAARISPPARG